MRTNLATPLCLVVAVLLAGCANNAYLQAKQRTAAGGELDQQEAAAQRMLQDEQRRRGELQSRQRSIDAEVARNAQRVFQLQGDLKKQDDLLAAALKARKITKAQHDQLKGQLEGLRADAQRAELENHGSALSKSSTNDAAKQAVLARLEERKRALEKALSAMTAQ